ncbi:glycosyltransferase family 2 protein, partial [Rosenbergiella nectarea]
MNLLSNDINIQLSIIIPTFNTEKYIYETLESLSNINKINTEIIIIDDCSHDKT